MTGNLLGEEFDPFVFRQIRERQTRQASGFNGSRTPEDIKLLNSKTSFVKLASGVNIFEDKPPASDQFQFKENPTFRDYEDAYDAGVLDNSVVLGDSPIITAGSYRNNPIVISTFAEALQFVDPSSQTLYEKVSEAFSLPL